MKFFKNKKQIKQSEINESQEFVEHFDAQIFQNCPSFQNLLGQISNFSPKGQFTVKVANQEVCAKSGEVEFKNKKFLATSFVFPSQKTEEAFVSRYVELRETGNVVGIGNVWHTCDKEKYVFLYENKATTNFKTDVFSIIKISHNNEIKVEFFDNNANWLGKSFVRQEKGQCLYDFYMSANLIKKSNPPGLLCAVKVKGGKTVSHPISAFKNFMRSHREYFVFLDDQNKIEKLKNGFVLGGDWLNHHKNEGLNK